MIVVEQLEKMGYFNNTDHVKVEGDLYLFYKSINLQKNDHDKSADCIRFNDNAKRDKYITNLIKWITDEQFGGAGELEVGKECLVSDDGKEWKTQVYVGKIDKCIGEEKSFLTINEANDNCLWRWEYAKAIGNRLEINGEYYTWESK